MADASRKDVALQETFHEVKVDSMMEKDPETVTPEVSLQEIVTESFLRRGHRAVPVCDDGQLVGIVSITDIKDIPREQWASTTVGQVMTQQPLHRVSADDDLTQALNLMNEHDVHQILVTDDGSLEGLINRAHVVRYLQVLMIWE